MTLNQTHLPGPLQRLPALVKKERDDLFEISKLPHSIPKFQELIRSLRLVLERLPSSPKLVGSWCNSLAEPLASYIEYFPYFENQDNLRLRKSPLSFIEEVHEIISSSESLLSADMGIQSFSKLLKSAKSMLRYYADQQNLNNFEFGQACAFSSGKPVSAIIDTADIVDHAKFSLTLIKGTKCKSIEEGAVYLLEHKRVLSLAVCAIGPKRKRIMLYPSFRAHEFSFHHAESENTLVLHSEIGNIELKGKRSKVNEWAVILDDLFNRTLPANDATIKGLGISLSSEDIITRSTSANTDIFSGDADSEYEPKKGNRVTIQNCVDLGLPFKMASNYDDLVARVSPAVPDRHGQKNFAPPPSLALPTIPVKGRTKISSGSVGSLDNDSPRSVNGAGSKPKSKTLLEAVERRRKIEQDFIAREKQQPVEARTQFFGEPYGMSSVSLDSGSLIRPTQPETPTHTPVLGRMSSPKLGLGIHSNNSSASKIGASIKKTLSMNHGPANNSTVSLPAVQTSPNKKARTLKDLFRRKQDENEEDLDEIAQFRDTGSDIASQVSLPYASRQVSNIQSKSSLSVEQVPPSLIDASSVAIAVTALAPAPTLAPVTAPAPAPAPVGFEFEDPQPESEKSEEPQPGPEKTLKLSKSTSSSVRRPLYNIYRSTSSNKDLAGVGTSGPNANARTAVATCNRSNNSTIAMNSSISSSSSLEALSGALNSEQSYNSLATTETMRTYTTASSSIQSIQDYDNVKKAAGQLLTLDLSSTSAAEPGNNSASTLTLPKPSNKENNVRSVARKPVGSSVSTGKPLKTCTQSQTNQSLTLPTVAPLQTVTPLMSTPQLQTAVKKPGQLKKAAVSMPSILAAPEAPLSAATSRVSFADDTEMVLFGAPMWVSYWSSSKWIPFSQSELQVEIKVNQAGNRINISGDGVAEVLRLDKNADVKKIGAHDIEVRIKRDVYIMRSSRQEVSTRFYNAILSLTVDLSDPTTYPHFRSGMDSSSSSVGSGRNRILTPPLLNKRKTMAQTSTPSLRY